MSSKPKETIGALHDAIDTISTWAIGELEGFDVVVLVGLEVGLGKDWLTPKKEG